MLLFIASCSNNSGKEMCIGLDKNYLVYTYILLFIGYIYIYIILFGCFDWLGYSQEHGGFNAQFLREILEISISYQPIRLVFLCFYQDKLKLCGENNCLPKYRLCLIYFYSRFFV